jgi:hypothetical protein
MGVCAISGSPGSFMFFSRTFSNVSPENISDCVPLFLLFRHSAISSFVWPRCPRYRTVRALIVGLKEMIDRWLKYLDHLRFTWRVSADILQNETTTLIDVLTISCKSFLW